MDKIAQIKLAETHGVLAALADTGLLKVAAEEDFDFMTEKVAEALGDDYDMDQVISKTAGCEYLMDKIASEEFAVDEVAEVMDKEACTFADLGEFLMLKEAASVAGAVEGAKNLGKAMFHGDITQGMKSVETALKDAFTAKQLRQGLAGKKELSAMESALREKLRARGIDPAIAAKRTGAGLLQEAPAVHSMLNKRIAAGAAKTIGAYAVPTAAALYGGKKLYDRFKSDK